MWLGRAQFGVQCTERHNAPGRRVVETAAFDAAHVDIALIHKWFDEKRERLAAGPERRVRANVGP